MKPRTIFLFILLLLLGSYLASRAQAPGSIQIYGGPASPLSIGAGGTKTEVSETIYIGPGIYDINGTWNIYSKNIVIDSNALIRGTGSMQIYNPGGAPGGTASQTFIDGNRSDSIELAIVLNNTSGMAIKEISFPDDLVANGFTNKANNSLHLGDTLDLAVDGADIWLDSTNVGDLIFDGSGGIKNYSASRMVITNNRNVSHMEKERSSSPFFFPVGIKDGDYTPVSIAGPGPNHVSVTDYTLSDAPVSDPGRGMDRIWYVYGNKADTVRLYHNVSTNGAIYTDDEAYITRYGPSGEWTNSTHSDYAGAPGVHANADTIPENIPDAAAAEESFLTKKSNNVTTLSVNLISFEAIRISQGAQLKWRTTGEVNNKGFAIEYSVSGTAWREIGYVNSLAASGTTQYSLDYSFIHAALGPGKNFYRLRIEDMDGTIEYSGVRMVEYRPGNVINVYPNPFVNEVFISGLNGNEDLRLFDATGRMVLQQKVAAATGSRLALPSSLQPGLYLLQVIKPDGTLSQHKLIRQE